MALRWYRIAFFVLALLALGVVWWATRPLPGNIVRGRLGEAGWKLPAAAAPAQKVKFSESTRNAIQVSVPSEFVVELPAGATQLWFSVGVDALEAGEAVEFEIAVEDRHGWQPLFSTETVAERAARWSDYRVEVPYRYRSAARLRFEVSFRRDRKAGEAKAYWGSVMALGPRGARRWHAWLGDERARERPNVILISLDTLGARHLSWFGAPAGVSPHIDAWLDRSFSFRRAFANYPSTRASHASLFTGLYPVKHGAYVAGAVPDRVQAAELSSIPPAERPVYSVDRKLPEATLARALAEAGYVTVAFTENGLVSSDFGFDNGFDWYDNGRPRVPSEFPGNVELTFSKARHVLREFLGEVSFFLFVHTYEVHSPYIPKDAEALALVHRIDPGYEGPFRERCDNALAILAHNAGSKPLADRDCKRLESLYRGEIHYLDRVLHHFLTEQQKLPSARETLVVVTSDHGDEFCEHGKLEHGETLYNPVLHVPLAFYWPGRVERGIYDDPVELVDVKPTLLELAGLPVPRGLHGVSLAPLLLRKERMIVRQPAFAEMRFVPFTPKRVMRGECVQLGLPEDCRVERVAVQDRRFKLISSLYPPFELLFDLETDPGETRDVAAEFPAELERLRQWVRKYRDGWQTLATSPETEPPVVDPATIERLRGLGYIE